MKTTSNRTLDRERSAQQPGCPSTPLPAPAALTLFAALSIFSVAATAQDRPVPDSATAAMPAKAAPCLACHGPAGNSVLTQIPSLAGQTARYLYLQLKDFQEGRRVNDMMTPMVVGLSRDDMREIAAWFEAQRLIPRPFAVDPLKAKLGQAKAEETLCTMCHLGGFLGQNDIPRVAGQHFDYVVKQLTDFKARRRTNDAGNMTAVSSTLSDADIENLGHYLAGL
jgi:cytochrome c553